MSPLAIVIVLVLLACSVWLCIAIAKRRIRFQFSLRSLLATTAVVAIVLGLTRWWPSDIVTLQVPRLDVKRGGNTDLTHDVLVLNVSRRWGRTVIRVTPRDSCDEAIKAELFWLDGGNLRHLPIADKGCVSAITVPAPNEWPLLIGVVERRPEAIYVFVRWILSNGREGGQEGTHDPKDPLFDGGIEKCGKSYLDKTLQLQPLPRSVS